MATKASTAALRRIGRPGNQRRAARHPAGEAIRKACGGTEGDMEAGKNDQMSRAVRRLASAAAALWFAVSAPVAAAASGDAGRQVSYRSIDRAEIEHLQRWVSAGHENWCKDPRLVAAEELKRTAHYEDIEGPALNPVLVERAANGPTKIVYEWAPLDGRCLYRVTVERFAWLLPIAQDRESLVWVPTSVEIAAQD